MRFSSPKTPLVEKKLIYLLQEIRQSLPLGITVRHQQKKEVIHLGFLQ